ncbi:MAG: EAL domain-containing protein [Undibacterium sp.]|uniref:putative bifunctional diguanylate cyclase/phosphodiesterase n=1 Tax=Undibacterium sp. TaxID=1914977 RepID=UPI0027156419|nr:EAL domain-containing protein [Undibacterium sp.]MDO8653197.1 EAL domain-containing protein [Undibacterium sp.]
MDVRVHESLIIDEISEPLSRHTFEVADSSSYIAEDAQELSALNYASRDRLTSLRNRFWLMNYLKSRINDAQEKNIQMALLFVDLDEFRNIKYIFGHAFSNELLCDVSARLSSLLRLGDHIARLSYGEFVFVLSDISSIGEAQDMAEQISFSLSMPFELHGERHYSLRASIGISLYPQDGEVGETLLKHADIAMYAAKFQVKESYLFYQKQMSAAILTKITLEQALRKALKCNEFILHYQPRVDSFTCELRGLEALIRWNHPERGLLAPSEFIPIAESSGLIVLIGERVIEMVCQQIARWKAQTFRPIPISINVSPLQLNMGDLRARLLRHTITYGIDPAMLEIEITESCIIEHDQSVKQQLNSFTDLGLKILLDDFGTGYSSLSVLQQFQIDMLKVDKSFIDNLRVGERGEALVSAIISMAHALDMKVVAEGVETIDQLRLLQALSCDEIQGYFISKPMAAVDVSMYMSKTPSFNDEVIELLVKKTNKLLVDESV